MPDEKLLRTIIREEMAALASPWLDTKHAEAYAAGKRTNLVTLQRAGLRRHLIGSKPVFNKKDIDRVIETL